MLGKYDVCVVGAGIAGSLVAETLARSGAHVALVEAGRSYELVDRFANLQKSRILGQPLWPWHEVGRDEFVDESKDAIGYSYPLNGLRVKGVGGSTLHWGGLAQRFRESDFDSFSRYGIGVDWPISYADLEPYYVRAEKEIGVSGGQNADDPPRSAPLPMPAFPESYSASLWLPTLERLGIAPNWTTEARNSQPFRGRSQCVAYSICNICPSGARYSADFHARLAVETGRCDLFTHTVARHIELDADRRVRKLHVTNLEGQSSEIVAGQYVLAAHAVETARLLMLSNFHSYLDQLGRNLMEHWYVGLHGYQDQQLAPHRIGFDTLESVHFYDDHEREQRGAIKLEFGANAHDSIREATQAGLSGQALQDYDCEKFGYLLSLGAEVEHQPNPNSRVTLHAHRKDRFGDAIPVTRFALDDIDRRTHERAVAIVEQLLEARGVKDIFPGQLYGPGGHHMGTCRMGANSDDSVTDANCRVHGTDNLYVAGSSLFPSSGARQPTLTIAALALRLSEYLRTNRSARR